MVAGKRSKIESNETLLVSQGLADYKLPDCKPNQLVQNPFALYVVLDFLSFIIKCYTLRYVLFFSFLTMSVNCVRISISQGSSPLANVPLGHFS